MSVRIIYLLLAAALTLFWLGVYKLVSQIDGPGYNCSMSEISPDFTTEMKKKCREIKP